MILIAFQLIDHNSQSKKVTIAMRAKIAAALRAQPSGSGASSAFCSLERVPPKASKQKVCAYILVSSNENVQISLES